MKLSTKDGGNMGELHAKFHQNWWSGFRDIVFPTTFSTNESSKSFFRTEKIRELTNK